MATSEKRKKEIVEIRICRICHREFGVTSSQMRKIYCDDCKKEHYRERAREYNRIYRDLPGVKERQRYLSRARYLEKYKPKTYVCKICNEEFETTNRGRPCYCMECLKQAYDAGVYPFKQYYERRVRR